MALGDLIVKLQADTAQFQSDMGRAVHIANQQSAAIARGMEKAKNALAGLAAGFSAVVVAAQFRDLVQGIAELDDLAEKTGAAVEELSKLEQVAKIGGHQIATVETAILRLNKALSGVTDEESKGAGKALQALGLSADELRRKDPAEALRTIAIELNKFEDGGGKAALAMDLFGKSGAQALPFLKDLANFQGIATKVTAEQAAQAEALANSFRRLGVESENAKRALALELIPALANVVTAFNNARVAGDGFFASLINGLRNAGGDRQMAERDIVEGTDQLLRLQNRLDAARARGRGVVGGEAEVRRLEAQVADVMGKINRARALLTVTETGFLGKEPPKQTLNYSPVSAAAKTVKSEFDYVREVFKDAGADLQKFAEQYQRVLDGLLTETDEAKTQKFLKSLEILDNEFFRGAIGVKQYDQAIAILTGHMEKAADEMAELKQLLAQTDLGKTEEFLRKVALVDRAFFEGINGKRINAQQHEQLIKLLTETKSANKEAANEITEFWRAAAESMQRSMSDFFFDIMQGELSNLAGNFKRTIDRMVADSLAAQASVALFGEKFGQGGQIGGLVGKGVEWLTGTAGGGGTSVAKTVAEEVLTKVPSFDVGTPYVPRDMLAMIHKGERIVPASENQAYTRGSMQFNIYGVQDAESFKKVQGVIEADMYRAARKSFERFA